jgi:hypothetical protein
MKEIQNNTNPEYRKEVTKTFQGCFKYMWQDGLDLFSRLSAVITIFGWLIM